MYKVLYRRVVVSSVLENVHEDKEIMQLTCSSFELS